MAANLRVLVEEYREATQRLAACIDRGEGVSGSQPEPEPLFHVVSKAVLADRREPREVAAATRVDAEDERVRRVARVFGLDGTTEEHLGTST